MRGRRQPVTAARLAEILAMSERMIYRDATDLMAQGRAWGRSQRGLHPASRSIFCGRSWRRNDCKQHYHGLLSARSMQKRPDFARWGKVSLSASMSQIVGYMTFETKTEGRRLLSI